jgi:hypothetical protein
VALRIFVVAVLLLAGAGCGDPIGETEARSATTASGEVEVVKIMFERSGGFAGITRTVEISTEDLAAEDAAYLRRLIDESGFFDLPEEIAGDGTVADEFNYVVVIETGDRRVSVRTGDAGAPETLVPLLGWLNQAARAGGG